MRNKINNNTLLVVFGALLVLTVILFSGNNDHRERSFDKDIVAFSSEDISLVKLYPKSMNGESYSIVKEAEQWLLESGGKQYKANDDEVNSMLTALETLDVQSLVANNQGRWAKYEVTDSLASRVQLFEGDDIIADLYIGKFKFSQPRNMSTYVREGGEDETYRVNGFLSSTFN
ncbi:MAG TPA: DUF4340 domain-containing protein, partial [Prolixibacteraceae bacterium]|nr:DUF4340 domain-containing protein [Prolixibacteraceae bacterium]